MSERFGKGHADRIGRLWVLHLRGTSFERGLQHGTLMRYRVRETLDFYRKLPDTLLTRIIPEKSLRLKILARTRAAFTTRLAKNRDADALEEMRGLSVGLGMRPEDVAGAMVLADVFQCFGAMAERRRRAGPPVLPGFGCTSMVRETPGGGMVFGRNFDFWGAGYWDANPAVIFHHPDRGKAFCSIATGGFPTGGVTSINEDGLAVAVHQHGSRDSSSSGTPVIDIAHSIARGASTVDEALELAGSFKATGGWTLVLAGGSPPRAAALEVSSARQAARYPEYHALAATNSFCDGELSSRELQANVGSILSDHGRYRRAVDLLNHRVVTPAVMAEMLGDHFDPFAERERSAGFSISRITTLSSAVFSLHDRRFWVSECPAPSSKGGFVGFDLDAELGGERSPAVRLECANPPGARITAAQEAYLEAYREYIGSGDLHRVSGLLGRCVALDESEPTFSLMEGITRAMLGNHRGALSLVERSIELEPVAPRRKVAELWRARLLDLLDHRDLSTGIYGDLAENPDTPPLVARAARKALKKPFSEKKLTGILLDLTNGDTFE